MKWKNVATTVMLVSLSLCAAGYAQPSHNSNNLSGTFVVTVTFEGTSFKVLENFTRDGRSTVLLPFGPPCCNDTRVGGLGEWSRTGPREFAVTEYFFASEDTSEPLQRSRLRLTLDPTGNKFSGPFRFEIIDNDGNILFSDDGTFTGERLKLVPMDE